MLERLKIVVKVSGIIVCPSDVEQKVSNLNEVHSVYATSVEDDKLDHMIYLFVVKNNNVVISDEELTEKINILIKEELSIYAVPKVIQYIDDMPRTEIGKIDGKILDKLVKEK